MKRIGRRPLDPEDRKDRITVFVPRRSLRVIAARAERAGISTEQYARVLLVEAAQEIDAHLKERESNVA